MNFYYISNIIIIEKCVNNWLLAGTNHCQCRRNSVDIGHLLLRKYKIKIGNTNYNLFIYFLIIFQSCADKIPSGDNMYFKENIKLELVILIDIFILFF